MRSNLAKILESDLGSKWQNYISLPEWTEFFGAEHRPPSAGSSGSLMWINLDRILLLFFLLHQLLPL